MKCDYDNPDYDPAATDSLEGNDKKENVNENNAALGIRPVIQFRSESKKATFEFRTASGIKHDFIDSEFDWEVDIYLSAAQTLSRNWKLAASNTLLRLDEHDPLTPLTVDQGADFTESESRTPELSADRGRSRYWLNSLNLVSEHPYGKDSQFGLGFNYRILRNDESAVLSYEDYDRSEVRVKERHRLSSAWKVGADLTIARGDFDSTDMETSEEDNNTATEPSLAEDDLSDDLREFRLKALVENNAFRRHDLSLEYSFIGSRYDEAMQNDGEIHEVQLLWQHEYSRHVQTKLGAGPSYEKTEGQDVNWSGNGIAELRYLFRPGSFSLMIEKGYDVDNFSGSGERGFVDFWDFRSRLDYRLLKNLFFNGNLGYRHEDRRNPSAADESQAVAEGVEEDAVQEGYSKDRYTTGAGLRYIFLKDYSTSLNYAFMRQDSDRSGDDYTDHRLILILSWQKEWLRW